MGSLERNPSLWIDQVRKMLLQLLNKESYCLFLFGSRARHPNNSYGDIDVGLWGKQPVPQTLFMQLWDALDESDVPLKVDLVDFARADAHFKQFALQHLVLWNMPSDGIQWVDERLQNLMPTADSHSVPVCVLEPQNSTKWRV
jgi:hypothetical protein